MSKKVFFALTSAIIHCLFSLSTYAAEWAVVESSKAIVYADPEMSSPIGYFQKGKKIRVGEVKRNKGRVLPTVLNNKIVYVRVADLQTAKDLVLVKSATERSRERDKVSKRERRVGLSFEAFASSISDLRTVEEEQSFKEGSETLLLSGFGLKGQSRERGADSALKFELGHLEASKDSTSLTAVSLTGGYSKDLFQFGSFNLAAFAAFSVVPWAQYQVGSLFKVNGYGLGAQAGLEALVRLVGNWSLQIEGSLKALKLTGFELPEDEGIEKDFAPLLSGLSGSAFLSYAF